MDQLMESAAKWLSTVISDAPEDITSIYVEWNYGGKGRVSYTFYDAFGFKALVSGKFIPSKKTHRDQLGSWDWEPKKGFEVNEDKNPDLDQSKLIEKAAKSKIVLEAAKARDLLLIIGEHDTGADGLSVIHSP